MDALGWLFLWLFVGLGGAQIIVKIIEHVSERDFEEKGMGPVAGLSAAAWQFPAYLITSEVIPRADNHLFAIYFGGLFALIAYVI